MPDFSHVTLQSGFTELRTVRKLHQHSFIFYLSHRRQTQYRLLDILSISIFNRNPLTVQTKFSLILDRLSKGYD